MDDRAGWLVCTDESIKQLGVQLVRRDEIRKAAIVFFVLAFSAAGVAGLFGAFITKAAPVA